MVPTRIEQALSTAQAAGPYDHPGHTTGLVAGVGVVREHAQQSLVSVEVVALVPSKHTCPLDLIECQSPGHPPIPLDAKARQA